MKTVFIVNPSARNDRSLTSWKKIQKTINIPYDLHITHHPADVGKIIKELRSTYPNDLLYVIGVGGDGTMNSIISGTAGFDNIAIGYIPGGSGNDFARGFHWPSDPEEAYRLVEDTISSGEGISFDAGLFSLGGGQKQYFVNNIGVGFDASIAKKANESRLKKRLNQWSLGKLVYPILLCVETLTFTPYRMEIEVDGVKEKWDGVWFITISNQPYFGGGMKISPRACPFDGELDITIVSGLSKWKLLFLFISVFFGKHTELKEVHTLKGRQIRIGSREEVPVHADGETAGSIDGKVDLDVKVLPGNWKMLNRSRWQKC
ncbi:diacylglycerol kinase family lipid kinase [Rossellomorea aquimaris]|uniref:diacylglycerol/lipid kinase family protein n=1 Tax=Rossellomorea aquimaris TaxID=189382 RepID=UPI001CD6B1EF|nr:diacylglycerol kinase family protein [Rossellomorea aquimaris]MCA1056847.1 diacylglycerol kinase family lipid kinase [Rossellomorea aquimaris]